MSAAATIANARVRRLERFNDFMVGLLPFPSDAEL
jgi:hypothetical protein